MVADSDIDKANMFNDYFYSVFTQAATNQSFPIDNSSHLLNISISPKKMFTIL